jgi:hypothetical protein
MAVRYRIGNGANDFTQLSVSWTPNPDAEMIGTDRERSVEILINNRAGRYHDGQWAPGVGTRVASQHRVTTPVGSLHWDITREHAITLHAESGVLGVRCPREVIPDVEGLVALVVSIPYASEL